MVLLIPAAVRKIKAQGRKEGRTSERQRITAALAQLEVHEGSGGEATLSKADLLKILHADNAEDA